MLNWPVNLSIIQTDTKQCVPRGRFLPIPLQKCHALKYVRTVLLLELLFYHTFAFATLKYFSATQNVHQSPNRFEEHTVGSFEWISLGH